MVYFEAHDVYVPIFYVLLPAKLELLYVSAMNAILFSSDGRLKLSTFTADFEHALLNAARKTFPDAALIGCLFHWKQALRRKMLDLRIPKEVVHQLIGVEGCLMDILTVIPIEEIIPKGIPYIRANFNERGNREKFDQFWTYFVNTWIRNYPPDLWNYTNTPNARDNMVNRTNNPLERYNRTLNQAFPYAYPTMNHFVSTINKEARRYARLLLDIQRGHANPPPHAPVPTVIIPRAYHVFQLPRAAMTFND